MKNDHVKKRKANKSMCFKLKNDKCYRNRALLSIAHMCVCWGSNSIWMNRDNNRKYAQIGFVQLYYFPHLYVFLDIPTFNAKRGSNTLLIVHMKRLPKISIQLRSIHECWLWEIKKKRKLIAFSSYVTSSRTNIIVHYVSTSSLFVFFSSFFRWANQMPPKSIGLHLIFNFVIQSSSVCLCLWVAYTEIKPKCNVILLIYIDIKINKERTEIIIIIITCGNVDNDLKIFISCAAPDACRIINH